MSRPFTVIVSPASGRGRGLRLVPEVEARLSRERQRFSTATTRSLEHGRELARDAVTRNENVVVIGGDGLVHAVLQEVVGTDNRLAVIPGGTCNDFARSLGLSATSAIAALAGEKTRRIDVGKVADRYFSCIASLGLDSDVIETAKKVRLLHGPLVYPYATVKALARWKPATFTVEMDGVVETIVGYNVAVANGGCYGGGMKLLPDAKIDDGRLDVLWVSDMSRLDFLAQARKVFSGAHVEVPGVSVRQGTTIRISVDRPFMVYADGEVVGPAPVDVTVMPAALDVLVPG